MVLSELLNYLTPQVQIFMLIVMVSAVIRPFLKRQVVTTDEVKSEEELPPMEKRDFYLAELLTYNGIDEPRILIGINGSVYDVTKGRDFYGPGKAYGIFAGHDASRCFASFSTDRKLVKDEDDDLSDLNSKQLKLLSEWEVKISKKYTRVGKLLKAGEFRSTYESEKSDCEIKDETEKKDV